MNKVRFVILILQFLCSNSTALAPTPPTITTASDTTEVSFILDELTIYNPVTAQCDSSPLVTASNQRINKTKLRSGAVRWMALSRDLLKRWGGQIQYGDTVSLYSSDPAIDGNWIVHDTMHRRFRNRGDLLFDSSVRTTGKWSDVIITLRKNKGSV